MNYHLRALEDAGLLELVEERTRRGFTERILAARADAFVVDPAVLGAVADIEAQDRYAAEHLIGAATRVVRDVVRMQAAAPLFRTPHQVGLTVDACGPGLAVAHPDRIAIVTAYGFDDAAFAEFDRRRSEGYGR